MHVIFYTTRAKDSFGKYDFNNSKPPNMTALYKTVPARKFFSKGIAIIRHSKNPAGFCANTGLFNHTPISVTTQCMRTVANADKRILVGFTCLMALPNKTMRAKLKYTQKIPS